MGNSIPAVTLSTDKAEKNNKNELSGQSFEQNFNTPAPQGPSELMYQDNKIQVGQKTLEKLLELLRQMGFNKGVQDLSNQELSQVLEMADLPKALKAELSRDLPKLRQALVEVDIAIQKAQNGQIDWSSAGASMAASIVLEQEKDKKYEQGFERLKEITSSVPTYMPKPLDPVHTHSHDQVLFYDQSAEAAAEVEKTLNELSPEAAAQIDPGQIRSASIEAASTGTGLKGLSPVSVISGPLAAIKEELEKDNDTPTPFKIHPNPAAA